MRICILLGLLLPIVAQDEDSAMEGLLSSVSMEQFRMKKRGTRGLLVVPGGEFASPVSVFKG